MGIELATGRPVDIAINHDADAIAMHAANHPYTTHYQEDVFAIDPMKVTGGRPVGIAWFSPDCKHFSRAKGNKPVEHKIRGLSWVIIKWAMSGVAPRCIFMENVEEIQTWGPLIVDADGKSRPDPERSGETFKAFVGMLSDGVAPDCPALAEACEFLKIKRGSAEEQRLINGLGYKVEFSVIRACDVGAPTIRKRFILVARNDGKPIVFPKPTHGKGKGLKPYRTAAECIDWSIPCPSIFGRKKPLVENTLRRIARGLDKFVIKNPKPYILEMNYDNPLQDVNRPMSTQTSANHHYLITPSLVQANYENPSQDVSKPMSTQTAVNKHFAVTPYMVPIGYGENKGQAPRVNSVEEPASTVVSSCKQYLTAPHLIKFQQNSLGQEPEKPLDTVMLGATRFGTVMPSIMQYHAEQSAGETRGQKCGEPLMTVDGSPRYAVNALYLTKHFSGEGSKASDIDSPAPTVTAKDLSSLTAANLVHYYGGEDHASPSDSPVPTVTVEPRHYLCTSNLCVLRKNMDGKDAKAPMPTLTTSAGHFAEIRTYILPVEQGAELGRWAEVRELLNKYAGYNLKDNEILIIEINGTPYFIGDIGMRMLEPEELKLAQGFPVDYIIDIESIIGKKYSKAKQIARLGNAVCPPVATALIRANCPELAYKRPIRTVAELEKVYARSYA